MTTEEHEASGEYYAKELKKIHIEQVELARRELHTYTQWHSAFINPHLEHMDTHAFQIETELSNRVIESARKLTKIVDSLHTECKELWCFSRIRDRGVLVESEQQVSGLLLDVKPSKNPLGLRNSETRSNVNGQVVENLNGKLGRNPEAVGLMELINDNVEHETDASLTSEPSSLNDENSEGSVQESLVPVEPNLDSDTPIVTHDKSSSSVDSENAHSQSTGEETPTGGESRCEHCGKPNQAALTAADTPAVPRDPQPTVPTTDRSAA
ncbi:hypothetical protein [Mobiluncus mulieris]|uniref:hypothetical protein n=1 Tax=Mobiluncus mulieris TaxID=2052 RepID=UPI00146FC91A|nr:hypothetical protein [Mobiluncus mulieris]MCU9974454.1 hypothetical protein [Mobiluncus mulieris]NMW74217.1 hypothetical protein [Mobiluncus mulieris]